MPADHDDPTHRHGNDPDDLIAWRLAQGPIDPAQPQSVDPDDLVAWYLPNGEIRVGTLNDGARWALGIDDTHRDAHGPE